MNVKVLVISILNRLAAPVAYRLSGVGLAHFKSMMNIDIIPHKGWRHNWWSARTGNSKHVQGTAEQPTVLLGSVCLVFKSYTH